MKATITNVREGAQKSETRHTIVVTFAEKRENATGFEALMMAGIIAGGVTSYEATFDLVRIFAVCPTDVQTSVQTNGKYDPAKGYAVATSQLFKIGTEIDNELFNLFTIPILEVSDGKFAAVSVNVGGEQRIMSTYRRAGFFDRATCVNICKSAFAANIANGVFTPIQPTQPTQPAQTQPQLDLSSLLGGANAPA